MTITFNPIPESREDRNRRLDKEIEEENKERGKLECEIARTLGMPTYQVREMEYGDKLQGKRLVKMMKDLYMGG